MHNTTLQINLSPGDINYAHLMVPHIVNTHRSNVDEVLAIVDCCRPEKTKCVDPDYRFPKEEFKKKSQKIRLIAEKLKQEGYLDRIIYLTVENPILSKLSRKYLNNIVRQTHSAGGTGLMSYLAALELTNTRYLLHYDADMLIHQDNEYDWTIEAKNLLAQHPQAIAATPRTSPLFSQNKDITDAPSLNVERPIISVKGGWRDDWFSSRCLLLDLSKLSDYYPLLQGNTALIHVFGKYLHKIFPPHSGMLSLRTLIRSKKWWLKPKQLVKTFIWRYIYPVYPADFEILLFKTVGSRGGWRLNLCSEKAWLLHPVSKPSKYIEILPQIIAAVEKGKVPLTQRGYANINLSEWKNFVEQKVV